MASWIWEQIHSQKKFDLELRIDIVVLQRFLWHFNPTKMGPWRLTRGMNLWSTWEAMFWNNSKPFDFQQHFRIRKRAIVSNESLILFNESPILCSLKVPFFVPWNSNFLLVVPDVCPSFLFSRHATIIGAWVIWSVCWPPWWTGPFFRLSVQRDLGCPGQEVRTNG